MMPALDLVQLLLYFGVLIACVPLLGGYMASVYAGESTWFAPVLAPLEHMIYRFGGVNPNAEMGWKNYAAALLIFNLFGFVVVFLLQVLQGVLPLNPAALPGVEPLRSEERRVGKEC